MIERKAKLWALVKPAEGVIQYSTHVEGGGAEFYDAVDRWAWVSKRRNSSYKSGASNAWVKTKCQAISAR
ncbi:ATP-dependent DNA ligase [Mesorhizobium shonense]|uniref:ATP-dependent DNA ligase n=1 Tax=Mesorhizobium shonense TaxID=1209948 RepID=A0ABV2HX62_9HYPH